MKVAIFGALFLAFLGATQGLDKCPQVKFVENFEPKRILGKWYAIEALGADIPCVSFNFVETGIPNGLRCDFSPIDGYTEFTPIKPDLSEGFSIKSNLELFQDANMRIPYIDYDNYGVTVDCKEVAGEVKLVITFGSRTKTLDSAIIEKLKADMTAKYGIDFSKSKAVEQQKC